MNRKLPAIGEFYHVYNQGVDKRNIFSDAYDSARFLESMTLFNREEPIGSIYKLSFNEDFKLRGLTSQSKKLVNVIAYCLNPNHFHLVLEQVAENGISEYMKRLGGGYTMYFNEKEKRRGSLFLGTYKSIHVSTNEYLLHLSAYVNLNDRVHQLEDKISDDVAKLIRSSWEEYVGSVEKQICSKDIILEQFKDTNEYRSYAGDALLTMLERKKNEKEIRRLTLE